MYFKTRQTHLVGFSFFGGLNHIFRLIFVSPELSSGRDLVIQMSVRRAACAVRHPPLVIFFLSGAYLRNRMTYLDDIQYVGGARAKVAHAEF